ncbi:hypothetical protein ACJ73_04462 [Blastomyces percursus]|uniref:Uncharacterized protein n=1 Tax=Blastomyces percursus TaxID=1658174 RepID=A0A1J9Q6S0_9EURO|nr:hypothetical protein ACJ73_04462 [Blastomyces percursus]
MVDVEGGWDGVANVITSNQMMVIICAGIERKRSHSACSIKVKVLYCQVPTYNAPIQTNLCLCKVVSIGFSHFQLTDQHTRKKIQCARYSSKNSGIQFFRFELAKKSHLEIIPELQAWWCGVDHPNRLAELAKSTVGTEPSSARDTKTTTKASSTYSRNFQQNLIDHSVYPPEYKYPDGQKPPKPDNWAEIHERLAQLRASLSPSKFSEKRFEDFREADAYASKEKPVTDSVIPVLDGDISDRKCVGGEYPFGNLAPLTDGTLSSAKPDHFFGARLEQLNRSIREALSDQIMPSTQPDLPMAPNFFLEAKGPDGSPAVAWVLVQCTLYDLTSEMERRTTTTLTLLRQLTRVVN